MMLDNENEYRRLLYVAMTRAADRLIVCGSVGEKNMPPGCWYELIEQGLEATNELTDEPGDVKDMHGPALPQVHAGDRQRRRRRRCAGGPAAGLADHAAKRRSAARRHRCGPPAPSTTTGTRSRTRRRAPPRAGARHARAPPDAVAARRSAGAPRRGRAPLSRAASKLDDAERTEIAEHTLRLLGDLRFDKLFLPGSRAEVSIVGRHNGTQRCPARSTGWW